MEESELQMDQRVRRSIHDLAPEASVTGLAAWFRYS